MFVIIYLFVLVFAFSASLTALVCIEDNENLGKLPGIMKGKWKVACIILLLGNFFYSGYTMLEYNFKDEPKPKYEMIDQGHYYKMVPNNN